MIETRVKTKITYADGTERTATMNADSAKNLVANAYMNDEDQIKKIEIEYVEDTAAKYKALVTGLSAGITAMYQQINSIRVEEIQGTLPVEQAREMIEQYETAIDECKKCRNKCAGIYWTARNGGQKYEKEG